MNYHAFNYCQIKTNERITNAHIELYIIIFNCSVNRIQAVSLEDTIYSRYVMFREHPFYFISLYTEIWCDHGPLGDPHIIHSSVSFSERRDLTYIISLC